MSWSWRWSVLFLPADANWLLQCSSCIDQAYYSDETQKRHISAANTSDCYAHVKRMPLQVFEHQHEEFFNKFFSRQQLGLDPNDVRMVLPGAISTIPERRWTAANGTSVQMKNVALIRDSQVLFALLGATQEVIVRMEEHVLHYLQWKVQYSNAFKDLERVVDDIVDEQKYSRKKREEMLEQVIRAVATAELVQKNLARTEGKVGHLDDSTHRLGKDVLEMQGKIQQLSDEALVTLRDYNRTLDDSAVHQRKTLEDFESRWIAGLEKQASALEEQSGRHNAFVEQQAERAQLVEDELAKLHDDDRGLNQSLDRVWEHLKKEASVDLVERRRISEAEVELALVKQNHDKMRYEEEQEALRVKHEEERRTVELQDERDRKRIQMQQAGEHANAKEMLELTEASTHRLNQEKHAQEKERLAMQLALDKEKAELELQQAVERAKIEAEASIREKRDNADVHMAEQAQAQQAEREKVLAAIQKVVDNTRQSIDDLYRDPMNLLWGIGSIVGLFAGIYFSREFATLAREQLNKRLGRPSLVRRTSRKSLLGDIMRSTKKSLRRCCGCALRDDAVFDDVVLSPDLQKQVMRLANAARTAKSRKSPLLNIMFYGLPGTGKTMVAERFAEFSGLEYAIMAGGDVAPLEEQAVTELHKLFQWVKHSRRGVLLFIDEADAFLCSRNRQGMSENLRNALTTMLYHTGTASKQFMLVLATNRPGDLDTAVLDRIDEAVEFPLPDTSERGRLMKQYYSEYISRPMKLRTPKGQNGKHTIADRAAGEPSDDVFMQVAQMLNGFSGREISKLCMALQTHIFAEAGMSKAHHLEITTEMLFEVVTAKVKEHNKALRMISEGYAFKMRSGASEGGSLPPTPSGKNLLPGVPDVAVRRC